MRAQKPREIASRLLLKAGVDDPFVEGRLDDELQKARLSGPDRALCQALVYGVVRWERTLDWLISRKATRKPKEAGPIVLLRLGLFQLFWLDRVPDYACVNETVELAKKLGFRGQAGFVNAVLRRYADEREITLTALKQLKVDQPAIGYSHPDWLCSSWELRWGRESLVNLLEWDNLPAPIFARVNALKVTPEQFASQATAQNYSWKPIELLWTKPGTIGQIESAIPLTELSGFRDGWFYIQDPSTLLSVQMLAPQPGERILDLCAAPGGKTTYIAQCMENRGAIVASDNQRARLELVRQNCTRLGVTCVTTMLGTELANGAETGFDRVLVDAPCSNTGVLRRRVQARWRLTADELVRLRKVQMDLLNKGGSLLRPGGRLVYSTCSLEPDENENVAAAFLDENQEFELLRQQTLLPFRDNVDGAFVATFERKD